MGDGLAQCLTDVGIGEQMHGGVGVLRADSQHRIHQLITDHDVLCAEALQEVVADAHAADAQSGGQGHTERDGHPAVGGGWPLWLVLLGWGLGVDVVDMHPHSLDGAFCDVSEHTVAHVQSALPGGVSEAIVCRPTPPKPRPREHDDEQRQENG